jgi:hypothetical protein
VNGSARNSLVRSTPHAAPNIVRCDFYRSPTIEMWHNRIGVLRGLEFWSGKQTCGADAARLLRRRWRAAHRLAAALCRNAHRPLDLASPARSAGQYHALSTSRRSVGYQICSRPLAGSLLLRSLLDCFLCVFFFFFFFCCENASVCVGRPDYARPTMIRSTVTVVCVRTAISVPTTLFNVVRQRYCEARCCSLKLVHCDTSQKSRVCWRACVRARS